MHVVTAIKTDNENLGIVLDSLEKLHMHIDKVIKRAKSVEIIADKETNMPDDLIYNELYRMQGVKKIFAKVFQENKHMYA